MTIPTVFHFLLRLFLLHWIVRSGALEQAAGEASFKSLCSRKCDETGEQPVDQDFPLYQCSCSPSCSTYGDCCFDSRHKNASIEVWQRSEFVCLPVKSKGEFLAVYSCPRDQRSDFCKEALGHSPPVTSKTTNVTYANTFCAACNGDSENLVRWNVELSCSEDEVDTNDLTRIIQRSGDVWQFNEASCMYRVHFDDFSFLDGLELRPCTNARKIQGCSASWTDLSILEMCRSYIDPVYVRNKAYQNYHCAVCDYRDPKFIDCIPSEVKDMLRLGINDSSITHFCMTRGAGACIHRLTSRGRDHQLSKKFNIREEVCVPVRGRKCCDDKRFDPETGRCKKVVRG